MNRVQQPRPIAVLAYLFFSLAGMFFMAWSPNISIKVLLGAVGFYAWNWFLLVGGIFGIIGAWNRNFRVEVVGIPLLWASTVAYAVSLLWRVSQASSPGVVYGLASVFAGVSFLFIGQGYVLYKRIKVANDIDRRAADGQ